MVTGVRQLSSMADKFGGVLVVQCAISSSVSLFNSGAIEGIHAHFNRENKKIFPIFCLLFLFCRTVINSLPLLSVPTIPHQSTPDKSVEFIFRREFRRIIQ